MRENSNICKRKTKVKRFIDKSCYIIIGQSSFVIEIRGIDKANEKKVFESDCFYVCIIFARVNISSNHTKHIPDSDININRTQHKRYWLSTGTQAPGNVWNANIKYKPMKISNNQKIERNFSQKLAAIQSEFTRTTIELV